MLVDSGFRSLETAAPSRHIANMSTKKRKADTGIDLRQQLLAASLPIVPFEGWSERALLQAAAAIGVPAPQALNAFPGGAAEMIAFHSAEADARMLEALEREDMAALKVRERIALAVRTRLTQNEPNLEAVRRGLSYLAMPQHAALATRLLYRTVDAMWLAAGDRSTDYNFYSKRLLLAGVYSSTLLVWLDDGTQDKARTWAFLERRIDNVLMIGGKFGRGMKALLDLPERMFDRRLGGLVSRARAAGFKSPRR